MSFVTKTLVRWEGTMRSVVRVLAITIVTLSVTATVYAQQVEAYQTLSSVVQGQESRNSALDQPALLDISNMLLAEALILLNKEADIPLVYSPSMIPTDVLVTCPCERITVGEALSWMLARTGLEFSTIAGRIVIGPPAAQRGATLPASEPIRPPLATGHAVQSILARSMDLSHTPRLQVNLSGVVEDDRTAEPLAGAHVQVLGTDVSALTNASGRFRLVDVPTGERAIEVRLIGYATVTETVHVAEGGAVELRFRLRREAIPLDEIVVTGTPGQARRREVGNTIAQISTDRVDEPVATLDALLQGRAAGMSVHLGSGTGVGTGAHIRLRGNVSAAMSNQPLVYIDGVRALSEGYVRSDARVTASPLNDINPNDIERIEVIRGAAASTLYGSEAAAGVIQIFTRRGRPGTPTWTLQVDQAADQARKFAGPEAPYLYLDPWLRTGHRQRYNVSVSGGSDDVSYYVSGNVDDHLGILPNDHGRRITGRSNLGIRPMDGMSLELQTAVSSFAATNTVGGNASRGFILNVFRGDQNYIGSARKEDIDEFLDYEAHNNIRRFTTGFTATYSPVSALSNRLTVGLDQSDQEVREVLPWAFIAEPDGRVSNRRHTNTILTLDFASSLALDVSPELRTTLSLGGQLADQRDTRVRAEGSGFPGPGEPTVSAGAIREGWEDRMRIINGGLFVQGVLDFRDRYFLTAGLRVDGNSAFGRNLGVEPYPKVSVSYILSDEAFWRDSWGQMKLRAAYGHAGRAPGAFDAVRTWSPQGWRGESAFWPDNVGNPDLGPERTAEVELGFDASVLGDRLSAEFTYYRQKTTDALFNVRNIPSSGFLGSQLTNVGSLENRGVELSARAVLVEGERFGWDLGGSLATNHSKVLDMGGAPEFSLDFAGFIAEGHPVPVIRGGKILNPDELADPLIEEDAIFGPNLPTHIIGVESTFYLPASIRVTARGEYNGGHYMQLRGLSSSMSREVSGWPICIEAHQLRDEGRMDEIPARKRMECFSQWSRHDRYLYPADFFRIRELTVTAPVGFLVPGANRASLTMSARNFWSWINSDWPMFDPEMSGDLGMNHPVRYVQENVPPPITYTASIRVVF